MAFLRALVTFLGKRRILVASVTAVAVALIALNWDYDGGLGPPGTVRPVDPADYPQVAAYLATIPGFPGSDFAMVVSRYGVAVRYDAEERREGRRVANLTQRWGYCHAPTNDLVIVPTGFETDFSSIPGFAAPLVYAFGSDIEAAVAHDWLYALGSHGLTREQADHAFRYAMREQGVAAWTRNLMYLAVRVGGENPYGSSAEWRFRDPETSVSVKPPFTVEDAPRPAKFPCDCLNELLGYLDARDKALQQNKTTNNWDVASDLGFPVMQLVACLEHNLPPSAFPDEFIFETGTREWMADIRNRDPDLPKRPADPR